MDHDSCFQLGYIVKPHGLNGEVKAIFEADSPQEYNGMESVFVDIQQKLVPFFILNIRTSGKFQILKIEDVEDWEQANELVGKSLWLPLDFLPKLPDQEFYLHEIIGYLAIDEAGKEIGRIKDYYSNGPQQLLSVLQGEREILIPLHRELIKKVDKNSGSIIFELPDGLLDIYLE